MASHNAPSRPLFGISFRVAAMINFAMMAALVKAGAAAGVPLIELVFFRNLFGMLPILVWMYFQGGPRLLVTRNPRAHLLRGAIGLVSMAFNFLAVVSLPLNEATAIGFSMPLFSTILSAMLLSEHVGKHRWAAVAAGFVGILILVRPDPAHFVGWGAIYALLGALGTAGVTVAIRQLTVTENPIAITFYFSLIASLASGLILPFVWEPVSLVTLAGMIAMGVVGGIAQAFMTSSLRYAPVSLVVPFDYTQILWIGIIAWLFFGEVPHAATLIGGPIVIGSGLYILWRETVRHGASRPAATPTQSV